MHTVSEELKTLAEDLMQNLQRVVTGHVPHKRSLLGHERTSEQKAFTESFNVGIAIAQSMLAEDGGYESIAPTLRPLFEERARSSIPIESVLQVLQVGTRNLWEAIEDSCRRLGLSSETAHEANARIFLGLEQASKDAAYIYDQVAKERELEAEVGREEFLRELFFQSPDETRLAAGLHQFGLKADQLYHAVVARVGDSSSSRSLAFALQQEVGSSGLIAVLGDDAAGVVARPPRKSPNAATLGIGPAQELRNMAESFRIAARILESARAFGLTGIFDLRAIGLRLAVHAEAELSNELSNRYLTPVIEAGAFADELIRTLEVFLECNLSVQLAAEKLFIHRNSLSKRLRRYEELASVDLGRIDDLVGLRWALLYRRTKKGRRE